MRALQKIPVLSGLFVVCCLGPGHAHADAPYTITKDAAQRWTTDTEKVWAVTTVEIPRDGEAQTLPMLKSTASGEEGTGRITSPVFTVEAPLQRFVISGADGTASGTNNGDTTFVRLLSHPDGEVLRIARPPGTHVPMPASWHTSDLIGREVVLEVVDGNPRLRPDGFAWIGFAGYEQVTPDYDDALETSTLSSLDMDGNSETIMVRSMPFRVAPADNVGETTRTREGDMETIPVGFQADALYVLGMVNHGWDFGTAHWGEHPELNEVRDDQLVIGTRIGDLEVHYTDGTHDTLPLIMGSTAFYIFAWVNGPTHGVTIGCREPFASVPEMKALLDDTLRLRENEDDVRWDTHYFLPITPQPKPIDRLVLRNNRAVRGRPYVSAVTVSTADSPESCTRFGPTVLDRADVDPAIDLAEAHDFQSEADRLGDALYMSDDDLPNSVEILAWPEDLPGTRIRFTGGVEADMLTNVWTQNLALIQEKFSADTGVFWESVPKIGPWYGGYNGFGTWAPVGVYWGEDTAFARCSDHYATVALRHLHEPKRWSSFTDYVDYWLYFYRHDHDPKNGPPNDALPLDKYPDDAYPNWSFVINGPMGMPVPQDMVPGGQESCGHGATVVARWMSWRLQGAPTGDWMTAPRDEVNGRSRWKATHDAAEFICWYMDFTGKDVMFSEGETTGWAARPAGDRLSLMPAGMPDTDIHDREAVRRMYANANMYEPYPTWTCAVALQCSAEMADAMGETELADRWREYSDRLRDGMLRLLRVGDHRDMMWRVSPHSVYPSLQDSLVHAWFAFYHQGYDPTEWDELLTPITRNTLRRQLSHPYGHAPVLAMGYGQGWLTKAALLLDEMDDAGPLLWNIAKYTYDKNMDYVDEVRNIDWRRWLYIIPEGTNILPDGRWHRIGDLSNGANQGPPMHAIEVCAGVDDTDPANLCVLPRVPEPLKGIEVTDHVALIPDGDGLARAMVTYTYERGGTFHLRSDRPLPTLSVRLGPFNAADAKKYSDAIDTPSSATTRVQRSGTWKNQPAWWVWVEDMVDIDELTIAATH